MPATVASVPVAVFHGCQQRTGADMDPVGSGERGIRVVPSRRAPLRTAAIARSIWW
ncbi:MAG: hypothetical protein R2789_07270 [Microthrixaceae bacterium]